LAEELTVLTKQVYGDCDTEYLNVLHHTKSLSLVKGNKGEFEDVKLEISYALKESEKVLSFSSLWKQIRSFVEKERKH